MIYVTFSLYRPRFFNGALFALFGAGAAIDRLAVELHLHGIVYALVAEGTGDGIDLVRPRFAGWRVDAHTYLVSKSNVPDSTQSDIRIRQMSAFGHPDIAMSTNVDMARPGVDVRRLGHTLVSTFVALVSTFVDFGKAGCQGSQTRNGLARGGTPGWTNAIISVNLPECQPADGRCPLFERDTNAKANRPRCRLPRAARMFGTVQSH